MTRILALLVLFALAWAGEPDQAALAGVLEKWKTAWNAKDLAGTLEVYSPESKLIKRLAGAGMREKYVANTQNIKNQLGDIVEVAVGPYCESGKTWVMRARYSIYGRVPGTFSIVPDGKGGWLLKAMNITGNGEKELKDEVTDPPPAPKEEAAPAEQPAK